VGHEVEWKPWIKVLLVFFLTADLFGNMGFFGKEPTAEYFRKTRILEIISADRGFFRSLATGKTISLDTSVLVAGASPLEILKEKHLPSMHLLYKLANIWGIEVIGLKRGDDLYKAFTGTPSISTSNLVDLYGVKYVISITPIEDPRYELLYARLEGLEGQREELLPQNTIKLYSIRHAQPRAWLVKDFEVLDEKGILSALTKKEFSPAQKVFLEEKPQWDKSGPAPAPTERFKNQVELLSESNNRLHLRVKTGEDSLLVLSDTYFPGWKARIIPVGSNSSGRDMETREKRILRANYNFRALPLKAGAYEIRFSYDPLSFKVGAIITLLAVLAAIGGILKKKKP